MIKIKKLKKKYIYLALIFFAFFLVALFLILMIQLNIIHFSFSDLNFEKKTYNLIDSCSIIAGQLIHPINDESACRIKCRAECDVRNMAFHSSDFINKEKACHECACSCI